MFINKVKDSKCSYNSISLYDTVVRLVPPAAAPIPIPRQQQTHIGRAIIRARHTKNATNAPMIIPTIAPTVRPLTTNNRIRNNDNDKTLP